MSPDRGPFQKERILFQPNIFEGSLLLNFRDYTWFLEELCVFPLETLCFFPEIQPCYDDEVGEKLGLEISMKRYPPQTTNLAPLR